MTRVFSRASLQPHSFWALSLLLGVGLRLVLGDEVEYWRDERFMFEQSQAVSFWEALTSPGMPSGVGVRNPGMSVAVFVLMTRVFSVQAPAELARAVTLLNIAALAAVAAIAWTRTDTRERRIWLWAMALSSVNPMAVMLHRKIWAQSTLPFFCIVLFLAWTHRHRRWGAFVWGLVGALLGQIHMSGFFFSAAVLIWTLPEQIRFARSRADVDDGRPRSARDRTGSLDPRRDRIRWAPWFLGSVLGGLPLIPWLIYVADYTASRPLGIDLGLGLRQFAAFVAIWVTDAAGTGLYYSLGWSDFLALLRHPILWEAPTFGAALLHAIAAGAALRLIVPATVSLVRELRRGVRPALFALVLGRPGDAPERAAFWGLGALLALFGIGVHRHYLAVTFPFEWIWLARLAFHNEAPTAERWLFVLWLCQLLMAGLALYYVHVFWFNPPRLVL